MASKREKRIGKPSSKLKDLALFVGPKKSNCQGEHVCTYCLHCVYMFLLYTHVIACICLASNCGWFGFLVLVQVCSM